MERFFRNYDFRNKVVLDLGPGHYDFCELARERGAIPYAIELDESVVKLGQYKKFEVTQANLTDPNVYDAFTGKVDLLFCRGSINCEWFQHKSDHINYLGKMLSVLKSNGSAWVSPCNEPANAPNYKQNLEIQLNEFKKFDFHTIKTHKIQAYVYGIWSDNPKLIYTKNLKYHKFPW
jgi:hypothetical protein